MDRQVVWGFFGAAGIAEKNWASVRRSGNGVLKYVGSRDVEKARKFIEKCQASVPFDEAPEAVEGYEAILADPEVDAVYIPLPTGIRKDWVIRAAEAGKHVLCEKPCAPTAADLKEMIAACEANGVQFMDGVMFMHNKRLEKMLEVVKSGEELGELRRVDSCFSFYGGDDFDENIRIDARLEPAGCLGDLGWYNIRIALCCFDGDAPLRVRATMLEEKNGVPTELRGEMIFSGSRSAAFHCSFNTTLEQNCRLSGTRGVLALDDFVQPFEGEQTSYSLVRLESKVDGCNYSTLLEKNEVGVPGEATNAPGSQETLLFHNFSKLVLEGKRESSWPEISMSTQRVVDAMMQSAKEGGAFVEIA